MVPGRAADRPMVRESWPRSPACRPSCPAHAWPRLPTRARTLLVSPIVPRPRPARGPPAARLPTRARTRPGPCPDPAANDARRDSCGRSGYRSAWGVAVAEHGSSARCGPGTSEPARQVPMSALVVRACMSCQKRARNASRRRHASRRARSGPAPPRREPHQPYEPHWTRRHQEASVSDPLSHPKRHRLRTTGHGT